MRGFRIAAKYDLDIDPKLFDVLMDTSIDKIPIEMIRDEFLKILTYGMYDFMLAGKLKVLIPELEETVCLIGRETYHEESVWLHSLTCYNAMLDLNITDPILLLTAWLHDIGKPESFNPETKKFTGHEVTGTVTSKVILDRLKINNRDQRRILWLVANHMWAKGGVSSKRKKWYNFFNSMRESNVTFNDFMTLRYVDSFSRKQNGEWLEYPAYLIWLDDDPVTWWHNDYLFGTYPSDTRDLKINGFDLLNLGIPAGKEIKSAIDRLWEMCLANEITNERDTLINHVNKHLQEKS